MALNYLLRPTEVRNFTPKNIYRKREKLPASTLELFLSLTLLLGTLVVLALLCANVAGIPVVSVSVRKSKVKKLFLICCRDLKMKYYSQKKYIKIINIFRVIVV